MKLIHITAKFMLLCILTGIIYTTPVRSATRPGASLPGAPSDQLPFGMPMGNNPRLGMPGNPAPFMTESAAEPAGQQAMPGVMPSPSAAEIEDAFAKVEEIQRTDPELFKQLEDAGKEIIKEMAKQDPAQLEAFAQSFGLKPEELLAEATKPTVPEEAMPTEEPAIEEFEETPEEAPIQPMQKTMSPTPQAPSAPKTVKKSVPINESQVQRTIAQVAEHIELLRTKMAGSATVYAELRSLELDLLSLALLIAIIDSPTHIIRLSKGEFNDLINALERLAAVLIAEEPHIQAMRTMPTKYDLLGITPQANATQLEKAFKTLKKKLDPKTIEKKLKKRGLSGDDLKRQVKAARITFSEIEEAYELIKDPITRRDIVDRAIELEAKQQGIDTATAKAAVSEIRDALSSAFYKDEILSKIEAYLDTYAPEALKQKKAQEKEEKKRLDEQKRRTRQSPIQTPGESFEPTISVPSGESGRYSYDSPSFYPDYFGPRQRQTLPEFESKPVKPEGSERGRERERTKEEMSPKGQPPVVLEQARGEKEAKKIDSRSVKDIIGELDKKFKGFSKAFDEPANQKLLKEMAQEDLGALQKLENDLASIVKRKQESPATQEEEAKKEDAETKKDEEETQKEGDESAEDQEAALRKELNRAQSAFEEKQKITLEKADRLSADIKLDSLHQELETLSKIVAMLRYRQPTDAESIAWIKCKESYEKGEIITAKKDAKKTIEKPRPSVKEKIDTLRKTLRYSTKGTSIEITKDAAEELLGSLNKKLKDISIFMKKIDSWFAQIPTTEQKQPIETPKRPATKPEPTSENN